MKKLLVLAGLVALAGSADAQLTEVWRVQADDNRTWFTTTSATGNSRIVRSVTYDAGTDEVYVASRDAGAKLARLNPGTGADIATTDLSGTVSGGVFTYSQIDVDEAVTPVIYFANLTTNGNSSAFKIYRMTDATDTGTVTTAFDSLDVGLDSVRLGDSLAVGGSGTGTVIYAATNSTTASLVRFTTADGSAYTIDQIFNLGASAGRLGLDVLGSGTSAQVWLNTSGADPVRFDASTDTLSADTFTAAADTLTGLGLVDIGGVVYLGVAPGAGANGGSPGDEAEVYSLASGPFSATKLDSTVSLANNGGSGAFPNGDGTSDVTFDTTRDNVIIAVTNNSVTAHDLGLSSSVRDWNLYSN